MLGWAAPYPFVSLPVLLGTMGGLLLLAGTAATLIVTSGDPLEVTTGIEAAYVDGWPVDLSNRQTRLLEKYQRKHAP